MSLQEILNNLINIVRFDILRFKLPDVDVSFLLQPIRMDIVHEDNGNSFWISFKDYKGVYTSGDTIEELMDNIQDALLTYYSVPNYIAKRMPQFINQVELDEGTKFVRVNGKTFIQKLGSKELIYNNA